MAKKMNNQNNDKTKVVNFYGTKKEWVKAELNIRMCDIFGEDKAFKETAVVAEDEQGVYVTGKSYVGAPLLDPYRLYRRIVLEVITDENNNISYKVKI